MQGGAERQRRDGKGSRSWLRSYSVETNESCWLEYSVPISKLPIQLSELLRALPIVGFRGFFDGSIAP
jgi:hypothetical protein